jgi:AcrR family transcriptional regulator
MHFLSLTCCRKGEECAANMTVGPARDELKPPLQQRSAEAHRRMVQAGLRLLELRDIDQIAIRDIVSEADTSVGSFYHRFGTKEQFFNHLIDDMIARREEAAMREIADQTVPIASTAEVLARGAMKNFRRHAGLLRSAVKWHIAGDKCWSRINMMALRIVNEYLRRLSESLGRPLESLERERINFAFVWLYGLLLHRTLRLNVIQGHAVPDKVFEEETIRNFRQLIDRAVSHWGTVRTKE